MPNTNPDLPTELFHYTSISALESIISTSVLWATQNTHLNDPSESNLLWPIIEKRFTQYIKSEMDIIVNNAKDQGQSIEPSKLIIERDKYTKTGREHIDKLRSFFSLIPTFVLSLSSHPIELYSELNNTKSRYDNLNGILSLWRGYGTESGVAIVFNAPRLSELIELESAAFKYQSCSLKKVIYIDTNNLSFPTEISDFDRKLRAFSRYYIPAIYMQEGNSAMQEKFSDLIDEYKSINSYLKHHAFSEEKEFRIVVSLLSEKLQSLSRNPMNFNKLYYRESRYGSVPYIRLFLPCNLKFFLLPVSLLVHQIIN